MGRVRGCRGTGMRWAIQGLVTIAAIAASGVACAADLALLEQPKVQKSAWSWNTNFGTLGPGIEAEYRFDEFWGVRGGINAFGGSYVYHDNNSDMPSRYSLLSAGLTADYYPYGGDFRLSAGARLSASKIDGKLRNLSATVKNGHTRFKVTIDDPLTDFTITQNPIQPYIGAGYSVKLEERVSLNFDLGALWAGTPGLSVHSRAGQFGFTHDQIRHEVERARDRVSWFKVYPVVQVGLKFSF
jgi:hypothetical protein